VEDSRNATLVPALIAQGYFPEVDVVTVPGEEDAVLMDDGCVVDVRAVLVSFPLYPFRWMSDVRNKVIQTVPDTGILLVRKNRGQTAQTPDCVDIALLLGCGESSPISWSAKFVRAHRKAESESGTYHSLRMIAWSPRHC
jgi:hypothetical protein